MSLHRRSLVLFMFERCSKLTADTPQPILGHDVTITWILVLKENILTGSVGWRQRDPLRFVDGGMKPPPPPPAPPSRGVTENQWRLPRPRLERDSGFLPGLATGGRSALESGAGAAFEHA